MKVLIIGSGGFVGKNLLAYLGSRGIEALGISSQHSNGISPHTGTLSDGFSIPPETHTVIYLAQSPFYRNVPEKVGHLLRVNVVSAVEVAEKALKAGVKRFIYTSTGNVYEPSFDLLTETSPLNRRNWYSLSKIHAEEALSIYQNDLDILILRLFGVYGPNQRDKLVSNLWKSIDLGKKIKIYRHPDQVEDLDGLRLSLIYIQDLLLIFWSLIYETQKIPCLNISSSEVVSIRQISNTLAQLQGKKAIFEVLQDPRRFDLIADNTRLCRLLNPSFTFFQDGAEALLNNHLK